MSRFQCTVRIAERYNVEGLAFFPETVDQATDCLRWLGLVEYLLDVEGAWRARWEEAARVHADNTRGRRNVRSNATRKQEAANEAWAKSRKALIDLMIDMTGQCAACERDEQSRETRSV